MCFSGRAQWNARERYKTLGNPSYQSGIIHILHWAGWQLFPWICRPTCLTWIPVSGGKQTVVLDALLCPESLSSYTFYLLQVHVYCMLYSSGWLLERVINGTTTKSPYFSNYTCELYSELLNLAPMQNSSNKCNYLLEISQLHGKFWNTVFKTTHLGSFLWVTSRLNSNLIHSRGGYA